MLVTFGMPDIIKEDLSLQRASLIAQFVKSPPAMRRPQFVFLGWEDPNYVFLKFKMFSRLQLNAQLENRNNERLQ